MEIYLMQHGLALPKDQDPEEGLSPEGEAAARAAGQALAALGVGLDQVLTSPKKRARRTAELVARALGYPAEEITISEKVKAMAEPGETVGLLMGLEAKARVLVAGHLPNLAQVARVLVAGAGGAAEVAFRNAGVCRIDLEPQPGALGRLVWLLPPEALALMAG